MRDAKYNNREVLCKQLSEMDITNLPYFGRWLSGFIEAEGCFSIRKAGRYSFSIGVRQPSPPAQSAGGGLRFAVRRITICISLKILNAILEHRTKYKKKKNFISLKFTVSLFWIFLLAISLNTHYLVKRTSSRTFSFLI